MWHLLIVNVCVSVCQVPVAEGKSVQQTVDMLHKKLEQLGAVKQGNFWVDCETYHATANATGNFSAQPYATKATVLYPLPWQLFVLQVSNPSRCTWCTILRRRWAAWLCLRAARISPQTQTLTCWWWNWRVTSRTPRVIRWRVEVRATATVTFWLRLAPSPWAPVPKGFQSRCDFVTLFDAFLCISTCPWLYFCVCRWSTVPVWYLVTAWTLSRSSCRAFWAQMLRRCPPIKWRVNFIRRWTVWTLWASTWSSSAKFVNSRCCRAAAYADTVQMNHRLY